jgi:anthranilate phosphoribosyltransferase
VPGLKRLLDVRRVVGLRNSSHSLVKLMNPCAGPAVVVSSYTHPEYAVSMAAVFELMGSTALLLRGTEGEVVADARRLPQMDGFIAGRRVTLQEGKKGTLTDLPDCQVKSTPNPRPRTFRKCWRAESPCPRPWAAGGTYLASG